MKKNTITDLVISSIHKTNGKIDFDTITKLILEQFPDSKWKKTHWAWFKTQINKGKYKDEFSSHEKKNLKLSIQEPENPENENKVKEIGDSLLNHVRMVVREISKDDEDFEFKLNRWVYQRLMQDERAKKKPIKKELWELGMNSCQGCNKKFKSLKGVEIHRIDSSKAYSIDNCELLCKPCHQEK